MSWQGWSLPGPMCQVSMSCRTWQDTLIEASIAPFLQGRPDLAKTSLSGAPPQAHTLRSRGPSSVQSLSGAPAGARRPRPAGGERRLSGRWGWQSDACSTVVHVSDMEGCAWHGMLCHVIGCARPGLQHVVKLQAKDPTQDRVVVGVGRNECWLWVGLCFLRRCAP